MKNNRLISMVGVIILISGLLFGCQSESNSKQQGEKESEIYYGQKPPGLIPEIFAPGIISKAEDMEFACTFSPDGQDIYYTLREGKTDMPVIMTSHQENGKWSTPEKLMIEGEGVNLEPHLSADGQTLYFGSTRQVEGVTTEDDGIWQLKKTAKGWDQLTYLMTGMYVSTTNDGSIYLTDVYKSWALVKIPFDGEEYGEAIRLSGGPNSPVRGIHPCIARDESFIVFDSERPGGYGGEGDLYVSFNQGDNKWSEGFLLGPEVNSAGVEFTASLSPDGKYLFFMKNDDIYWVDIKIIDQFR